MNSNTVIKIINIMDASNRKLTAMVALFIGASLIDIIGIGLIGPYISLLTDDLFLKGDLVKIISKTFNIPLDFSFIFILISFVLIIVFFIKFFVAIFIQWMILGFGYEQLLSLRIKLMKSFQTSDYQEYLRKNSADYIYTIESLTSLYIGKVLITIIKMVGDFIVAVTILIFLALINIYLLTSLALLMIGTAYIYDRLIRIKIRLYGKQSNLAGITMLTGLKEGLEGLKEIRLLGKEHYFYDTVKNNAQIYSDNQTKLGVYSAIPRYFVEFLMVVFIILAASVFLSLYEDRSEILSILAIFGMSAIRLIPAANTIVNGMVSIRSNENTISRLYSEIKRIKNNASKSIPLSNRLEPTAFKRIDIKNLHFSYFGLEEIPVLSGINLTIKKGEFIGIVGSSGSGKSTLIDILLGLLKPTSGDILYNGNRIESGEQDWRLKTSYLPQQVFLIDKTIKENIALGESAEFIDNDKIELSLEFSKLSSLVKKLPDGVNSLVGEGGIKISGGQRQRIALARAFYHDRDILVMDETTSALDNITENEIMMEMQSLKGTITLIIITHSEPMLKMCNHVYRVSNGKVIKK